MNLRELSHEWIPTWLRANARRRFRNVVFRKLGIARCYTPPVLTRRPELAVRSWLPFVLAHELAANPDLVFMQIGAFDGMGDDDLRALIARHHLRGVLIEPQPEAVTRLRRTYQNEPQVVLLEAAIAEKEGMRELFCCRGRPTMAASFDRAHLRRHGIPAAEIVARPVVCHTIESAIRAAGLERIDLLQIDAEGFDWSIIRSINFNRVRPAIIRFEYRNLPSRDADACLELLAGHGYRFLVESRDIIAHRSVNSMPLTTSLTRRTA